MTQVGVTNFTIITTAEAAFTVRAKTGATLPTTTTNTTATILLPLNYFPGLAV